MANGGYYWYYKQVVAPVANSMPHMVGLLEHINVANGIQLLICLISISRKDQKQFI